MCTLRVQEAERTLADVPNDQASTPRPADATGSESENRGEKTGLAERAAQAGVVEKHALAAGHLGAWLFGCATLSPVTKRESVPTTLHAAHAELRRSAPKIATRDPGSR